MSFVTVVPEALTAAADALHDIGEGMVTSGDAAGRVTAAVVAPANDEVSKELAACLCAQAQNYAEVSGRAASIFDEFVVSVASGSDQYVTAEADNATHIG
ncbi:PE family protein [Mycobacterium haemophilum]|uniref:PE domain-containing protein n=1 Tax=Mycobacterium haemophilum TaxID=29311 RepID=A0A0I9TFJ3_9MYCO|nr:PE family protein [Mycobacterium haemophilum]KLO27025.1 hypothetical protein ABH39_16645 [Mycobacterium haemophilum]KLO34956.1 hypothetical protein ABH38_17370 [Mycobacterium haemophilum]KLO40933.1 hypothetical protein ABH37_14945 [Mycobacterium haemophilum]KLO47257.1 hypothetical protein ABH36_17300 [Mycobacterium haemophilum]